MMSVTAYGMVCIYTHIFVFTRAFRVLYLLDAVWRASYKVGIKGLDMADKSHPYRLFVPLIYIPAWTEQMSKHNYVLGKSTREMFLIINN